MAGFATIRSGMLLVTEFCDHANAGADSRHGEVCEDVTALD
jgi:hypothetical protein